MRPALIGEGEKATEGSNEMVTEWLQTGIFGGPEAEAQREKIENIMWFPF